MRSGSGGDKTELANDVWGDIAVPFPRLPGLGRNISPLFDNSSSSSNKPSAKRNASPSPEDPNDIPASSSTESKQLGAPVAGKDVNVRRSRAKSFIPTSVIGDPQSKTSKPLPMPSTHVQRTDSEKVLDLEVSKAFHIENQMTCRRRMHASGLRRSAPPGQISCADGFELRRSKRSKTDLASGFGAAMGLKSTAPERKSSLASLSGLSTRGSAMSLTSARDMSGIFSIDM